MKITSRPKKMPRHPLASKIFSHEDQIFSHIKKIRHGPMWHFYQQAMVQKKRLEIRPCWVPNPQQGAPTVTMEAKRSLSLSISHVPKIGTTTCFPYPAMQVSNSWHTQDGFFLHEKEGYSQVMFSSLLKSNVVKCTILR